MSNNQVVIDTLIKKRESILAEKLKMRDHFDAQIKEIENALDQLAGKSVWRPENKESYDDENPNYIKGGI